MTPRTVALAWLLTVVGFSLLGQACYDRLHPPTTIGDPTAPGPTEWRAGRDGGGDR